MTMTRPTDVYPGLVQTETGHILQGEALRVVLGAVLYYADLLKPSDGTPTYSEVTSIDNLTEVPLTPQIAMLAMCGIRMRAALDGQTETNTAVTSSMYDALHQASLGLADSNPLEAIETLKAVNILQ